MRRLLLLAGMTAVSLLLGTQSALAVANNPCTPAETLRGKTTVCHVPPGNPANAMTICVGGTAPAAHLANHPGDHLGPCANPCPNGCDDGNACTTDTCGATGCVHSEPAQGCCNTAADCPDDGDVCTTATCTANVCGTAPVSGCCNLDTDCADDGNSCTDETCNAQHTCDHPDNGTCCCQQFEGPPTGTADADHCYQGCVACTGQCIPQSICPTVPVGDPSTCPGLPGRS
jgi:slime mold repeat-containing protein